MVKIVFRITICIWQGTDSLLSITGISPSHVDILMGTFTKSFGAAGGYIAASKVRIKLLQSNRIIERRDAMS